MDKTSDYVHILPREDAFNNFVEVITEMGYKITVSLHTWEYVHTNEHIILVRIKRIFVSH